MDQKITAYIEALVLEVLQAPWYSGLEENKKEEIADKLRDYFNTSILDVLIDNLDSKQLQEVKSMMGDMDALEQKLEEYASQIPMLITHIENGLNEAVNKVKTDPNLLQG
ncbi:hypothetical protein A2630_01095 [Candidatus Woesebacteria bacterium RIFCSPHIGHO2_01_FULL_44_10]|uniref:Uncharacterized protein n=1 Tax=Candidatus Woesebacteria bacterium RIFCSPLOWO2_01_FULL_44_14 TaxID=1802525 RepID=A0A1F8C1H6_9BACT|nr:MAG: hypothetical protein A2630_01095 [Candidatus Woesebacteria bacterium RIFCSPHIGHO2_01_FULL_44_10]OGM54716.1 MAG: hypothetical protein A3F62_02840 [Candidatus Woesebacteria bacterium RIFCSPHIGHO2_12_FULL_44_11]OGM70186.1 MAG: hypothetical protein A2975_03880 [Candidatus Woesebacteria bacterium RIFCSPLOWO2_01_FULL_44_14]